MHRRNRSQLGPFVISSECGELVNHCKTCTHMAATFDHYYDIMYSILTRAPSSYASQRCLVSCEMHISPSFSLFTIDVSHKHLLYTRHTASASLRRLFFPDDFGHKYLGHDFSLVLIHIGKRGNYYP